MKNSNLVAAKRAKNDEFYTCREDIEVELVHYADSFRGKTVYCGRRSRLTISGTK